MDNPNGADYSYELELCVKLITALEYIVSELDEHPSRYPALIADITCLVHGRIGIMNDGSQVFVNGLIDQIQEMYETLESLELEVEFGGEFCDTAGQG